jgi:pimeloyl-ACP methyl ester carboxylesterase
VIASLATTAPTQFLDIGGTRFAYRRFGAPAGPPLVFIQHFMGNLDNFDPAISDALAAGREIILFDNAGVGRSTGTAPGTIADMAADAASFIDGLGLTSVDILGHSMGGEIAQPALVVNGSNDIVIPTINSYHLYQHLPDAELMLLPDSGHGAHFQHVNRFVRRVIDFLDLQPHDTATPA